MVLLSAVTLLFRILVLCSPSFWSYTSKYALRSSTTRYMKLFLESKSYEIESIFFKSDIPFREQVQLQRTEQPPRVSSNKPRYNPTSENKKSKYSATKMKLRSASKVIPSYSATSSRRHVQEILQIAQKGSVEVLLKAITNANDASVQLSIAEATNCTKPAGRLTIREYNMLIKELCDGGRIHECSKILTVMAKAGVKPSLVTYTTLISRAGAWQKVQLAEVYFRRMLDDGIKADAQAYNSLINAYAKAGETDRCESQNLFGDLN
jgi:pentatricopeptide repeat protein